MPNNTYTRIPAARAADILEECKKPLDRKACRLICSAAGICYYAEFCTCDEYLAVCTIVHKEMSAYSGKPVNYGDMLAEVYGVHLEADAYPEFRNSWLNALIVKLRASKDIRYLLETCGNEEVFFSSQGFVLYREAFVNEKQYSILLKYASEFMTRLSYGQTRDFINRVADALGEF